MTTSPSSDPSAMAAQIAQAVSQFGAAVTARFQTQVGEPEEQLRGPVEVLLGQVGTALKRDVVPVGETRLADLGRKPDYGVFVNGAVVGYLELKAPDKGVTPQRFRKHDREQWEQLRALPNLAYSDGNNWAVYHFGELAGPVITCHGDVRTAGAGFDVDVMAFTTLLSDFLLWAPTPPRTALELARSIAGLCRLLRDEVTATLEVEAQAPAHKRRPFTELANDWRELLFPGASDERFADSYAQTITFALLLARAEGVDLKDADLQHIGQVLGGRHGLLGRALRVLTDDEALPHVLISLTALTRVISAVDWSRLEQYSGDPWRYFYEDFLAVYDPKLREEAGAYYTPPDVVDAQVRLVDELLRTRLGRRLGFADPNVTTIDPAMGTGAYLIHAVEQAAKTAAGLGHGMVDSAVGDMARRLIGFELMTGPYAVAEVLVGSALRRHDADEGLRLHLTDTLADPWTEEARLGGVYEQIARSRRQANEIKKHTPVLACLGNPPYDRHRSSDRTGGWVRWGDKARGERAVLDDFRSADRDVNLYAVNLYNLYVYFWRWALWKVFEAHPDQPQGVVSFITASSFTDGPGYAEMRAHMRRVADEIWIIDLSPEGHQPDVQTRVFTGVQVPVCITIIVRYGQPKLDEPAQAHIITFGGLRGEKFERLQGLSLDDPDWQTCDRGWRAPFTAQSSDDWHSYPELLEMVPWHSPGVTTERTWVIGAQKETLEERWRRLVSAPLEERGSLLKTNRNRNIRSTPKALPGHGDPSQRMTPLAGASAETPPPAAVRYGHRAFDRKWILPDHRLMYPARPELWSVASDEQLFLVTQHAHELRGGPGLVASAYIPDRHYYQGSFGGAVLPLWRDQARQIPNTAPGLLEHLSATYGRAVAPEQFAAYLAAVLAHPGYTRRFERELRTPGPRVPLTGSPELFEQAAQLGSKVLWLHTYGARFDDPAAGRPKNSIPSGRARAMVAVPGGVEGMPTRFFFDEKTQTLHVGEGKFAPVTPVVARYEISGMRVVSKWLNYRLAEPSGRRDSPLDAVNVTAWPYEWSLELLELLWALEALVDLEPAQEELLDQVVQGQLISTEQLYALAILPAPKTAKGPVTSGTHEGSQQRIKFTP